jgi:hypothetical protein
LKFALIFSTLALVGMPGSELHEKQLRPLPKPPRRAPHNPVDYSLQWGRWTTVENYRYRTGSRFAGGTTWERYLDLELMTDQASIRLTRIHYGPVPAPGVLLTFDHPEEQIKLVYGPVASWSWNVTVYLILQKQPQAKKA